MSWVVQPKEICEKNMDRCAAMETFVRVVDAGSFSSAAKQLHIGQPGVAKSVAQLEDRLGVRLLLRSTRGLMPTEAGRNFYDRAKRLIEEADEAERAVRGAATTVSGRLRICVTSTFAGLHVMHRLPPFLTQHPVLDVDVVIPDKDIDLIEAGIDMALRTGPLCDSVLSARKIVHCQRRVVGTPIFFTANGMPRTPADLITRQAIIYEINERWAGGPIWTFRQGTAETSVTSAGRVRVTAAEGVRDAVFGGLGFAIACEWTFAPELKSGSVVPVLEDWSLPDAGLWAVFPTGRQASVKARAFAGFMEQQLADTTDTATSSPSASCEPVANAKSNPAMFRPAQKASTHVPPVPYRGPYHSRSRQLELRRSIPSRKTGRFSERQPVPYTWSEGGIMTISRRDVPAAVRFGRFLLDLHRQELLADGMPVRIGSRALDILIVLTEANGALVSKGELMSRVWPRTVVEENTLQFQISTLRKALGPDRDLIKTVSGRGYRFIADISTRPDPGASLAQVGDSSPSATPPAPTRELAGREAILAELADFIAAHRLPTLAGGGSNKTRQGLVLQRSVSAEYADGARITALGPLLDPQLVLPTIASVLGSAEVDPGAPECLTAPDPKPLLFLLSISN
jgi:DNA-binding transcriptional LysR family regulator/DNA-binding winged helix-turn-helix (wHTH) protein